MQDPILVREPNLHVNDFDAATDVLQISREHDRHNPPHWGALPGNDMEFTTEWQMAAATAEAHAAN